MSLFSERSSLLSHRRPLLRVDTYGAASPSPKRGQLVNTSNVARDHMSNERTFLAYIRTGLSIASAGVALANVFLLTPRKTLDPPSIAGLANLRTFMHFVGAITVGLGIVVICMAPHRYLQIKRMLLAAPSVFPPTRTFPVLLSLAVAVISICVLILLILRA